MKVLSEERVDVITVNAIASPTERQALESIAAGCSGVSDTAVRPDWRSLLPELREAAAEGYGELQLAHQFDLVALHDDGLERSFLLVRTSS